MHTNTLKNDGISAYQLLKLIILAISKVPIIYCPSSPRHPTGSRCWKAMKVMMIRRRKEVGVVRLVLRRSAAS